MIRERNMALCLGMLLLAACASPVAPVPLSALDEVRQLRDPDFNGGLTPGEMDLSRRLAVEVGAGLPGDLQPCGQPDWHKGVSVGNINAQPDPDNLLKDVPGKLLPLAQLMLHGSPAQRATALHAVILIGRKADALAPALQAASNSDRDAWQAEALEALTCDRWSDEGIDALMPEAKRPPRGADSSCDGSRTGWLLETAADRSRSWPAQFFGTAWDDARNGCKYDGMGYAIPLADEKILAVKPLLDDSAADHKLIVAVFGMITDLGPRARPLAPEALKFVDSKDEELAHSAQEVVLASGVPEAVDILRHWVLEEGYFNWAWRDYLPGLAAYAHDVIPIMAQELKQGAFSDHAAAATALGELKSPEAIPYLERAIDSRDWPTSQAAVAALAQFAAGSPDVRKKLLEVEKTYWSGRVRKVAEVALKTGRSVTDDPFDTCSYPSGDALDPLPAGGEQHLGCISFNYGGPVDHHQKRCHDKSFHSGPYLTAGHRRVKIQWQEAKRQELPRGKIGDLSSWCASVGEVAILKISGGWLVGCRGFESDGHLGFLPQDESKPVHKLMEMGVTVIVQAGGHIYVAGSEPFGFNDAGALFEVSRGADGSWSIEPVAALPSPPDSAALLGDSVAFSDPENAVLFDRDKGLSLLSCQD